MRIVCVYTPEFSASTVSSDICVKSGRVYGYEVEKVRSVFYKNMDEVHAKYNLKKKYKPVMGATLTKITCPITRMANGTTHYLLYKWSVENNQPICIVEHDAEFVGKIPEAKLDGVIQISSHGDLQLNTPIQWEECGRGRKMKQHEPGREVYWTDENGVVKHPLSGTNGTSGYIIGPVAAQRMVDYIEHTGIAFADRIRTKVIGEDNLWLQKPQSVFCYHNRIKSHEWARRMK